MLPTQIAMSTGNQNSLKAGGRGPLRMGIRNLARFSEYKLAAKSCQRSQPIGRDSNRGSHVMKAGFSFCLRNVRSSSANTGQYLFFLVKSQHFFWKFMCAARDVHTACVAVRNSKIDVSNAKFPPLPNQHSMKVNTRMQNGGKALRFISTVDERDR